MPALLIFDNNIIRLVRIFAPYTVGIGNILGTGIKVIDLLCPFVKGGKTGLFVWLCLTL